MKTYTKNLQGELQETETKEEVHTYTLGYLKEQEKQLEASLAEVKVLLAECVKAGVK